MALNPDSVLAGVGLPDLAWFGNVGAAAPTSAISSLTGFTSAGLITEEGLTRGVDESTNDINAYGLFVPVRTLTTSSKITFQVAFLEHNPIALAVYHRLPLDAADLIPDVDGAFDFTEGAARTQQYAAVFDVADGENHVRLYCPRVQVTDRSELSISAGDPITYGVTLTAYAGDDGVAVQWFVQVAAFADEGS